MLYSVVKSGSPLPCAPIVCVDGFPSCRELRLRVLEMKDESTERQTDDTQRWLEAEETQKDDDERQAEPFRAGKRTPAERRGEAHPMIPSGGIAVSRMHSGTENAALPASAREEQTPGQRQQSRGG